MEKKKIELPLHISTDGCDIEDNNNTGICALYVDERAPEYAAFIVRACNNHAKLLEACKAGLWELQGNLEHGTAAKEIAMEKTKRVNLQWKVNTNGLMNEVMTCQGAAVLYIPLKIFLNLLALVAKRATVLNDKELNKLMLRLSLYDISNPKSESFDQAAVEEYLNS